MNNKVLKLLPAAALIIAGIVFLCTDRKQDASVYISDYSGTVPETVSQENDTTEEGIWIHIAGHVVNPGVYYMKKGSRLFEAVDIAGGMSEDASDEPVNLALVMQDGQHVYIPGIRELSTDDTGDAYDTGGSLIDINTASAPELQSLPGIGESKARAIIEYRERSPFVSIEDIMNVPGIKENSFEKIKDRIRV